MNQNTQWKPNEKFLEFLIGHAIKDVDSKNFCVGKKMYSIREFVETEITPITDRGKRVYQMLWKKYQPSYENFLSSQKQV